ncbi:MAG: hypothetical protein ACRC33_22640 [Gemmataceae bacterium]
MDRFLPAYGTTLGPLNVPMTDEQAFAVESILKAGGDTAAVRKAVPAALYELDSGDRADVAWITTEGIDHDREVVLTAGMDDSVFSKNPMVTLNHSYYHPPIGTSVWRRALREGPRRGVLARTKYPPRPAGWPADQRWPADEVLALVQAGLCLGKSIGFLPRDSGPPTEEELRQHPEWAGARRIVRHWLLVEYACTWMPCQPEALVANVSKGLRAALGITAPPAPAPAAPPDVAFTPEAEVRKALDRALAGIDAERLRQEDLDRRLGRV